MIKYIIKSPTTIFIMQKSFWNPGAVDKGSISVYKFGKYANIWDPWMMDSFKATSSVLGKRSIPTELVNMIQDFTHIKDQHTN